MKLLLHILLAYAVLSAFVVAWALLKRWRCGEPLPELSVILRAFLLWPRWVRDCGPWWARTLVWIAEPLVIVIGLVVLTVNGTLLLIEITSTPEKCRRSWRDIAEYPVLAEVCKNAQARRALARGDFTDDLARIDAGERVP